VVDVHFARGLNTCDASFLSVRRNSVASFTDGEFVTTVAGNFAWRGEALGPRWGMTIVVSRRKGTDVSTRLVSTYLGNIGKVESKHISQVQMKLHTYFTSAMSS
jgi:hypothetical protein